MKTRIVFTALALLTMFNHQLSTARAQGTAFTYQGRLNDGANAANGIYDLRFAIYDAATAGGQQGNLLTNSATGVTNGLFTVTLDFGNQFPGAARWLEIGVRTNGAGSFLTLSPRQALTPAPYAIFAAGANAAGLSGTISSTNIGGSYSNGVSFSNSTNSFSGFFSGSGNGLTNVWHTGGNTGTTPGVNYLGTADNQPLILKVNNQEVFRFESTTDAPNITGGYLSNSIQPGVVGATIGGGGTGGNFQQNAITSGGNFGVISGGAANYLYGSYGVIAGGQDNIATASYSSVGGGTYNYANGNYSTVGGGGFNDANGDQSTIGGGYNNFMYLGDVASTIAGGHNHRMDGNVTSSTIGGGYDNVMETNVYRATIAGGNANIIHAGAFQATIGGGDINVIGTNAFGSVIAGGDGNLIDTNSSESAIGGGAGNDLGANSFQSVIAGGYGNVVQPASPYSVIVGGLLNAIGTNSYESAIGGGAFNVIGTNSPWAVIAGGFSNLMGTNNGSTAISGGYGNAVGADSYQAVIAGGYANDVQPGAPYSAISGGFQNVIGTNATYSVISGGYSNTVGTTAYYSVIGGGNQNSIGTGNYFLVIAGGWGNVIGTNSAGAAIGGGTYNTISANASVIAGGDANSISTGAVYSALAGGVLNSIGSGAEYSVIAGGYNNTVESNAYGANIAGGYNNTIGTNSYKATIGGGWANIVNNNADSAVIAGGLANSIGLGSGGSFIGGGVQSSIGTNSKVSTIAGGNLNYIADNTWQAVIGGGLFNTNGGFAATVPGGTLNLASGVTSFAAGQRAKAIHDGTFVWADSQNADFSSTGTNQFDVRANGGVNFVTGGAGMTLDGQLVQGASAYAPASGSANYIQNQNSTPQVASFNIAGNATVSGIVNGASLVGNGAGVTNVNAVTLGGLSSSGFWKTTGNAGTTPAANFIGTTDNQPLVLRAPYVGIGLTNPVAALHVASTSSGTPQVQILQQNASDSVRLRMSSGSNLGWEMDVSSGSSPQLQFWYIGAAGPRMTIDTSGNVTTTGTVNGTSDRNAKENFLPVDAREVLDKVTALPITRWNYKADTKTAHVGPMAQDFHAAFNVGMDDKHIATVDEEGVALAAIQGLNQKLETQLKEKDAEIQQLQQGMTQLRELVLQLAVNKPK